MSDGGRDASPRIYHLAVSGEWSASAAKGESYRRSTLGRSLEEVGFIHCSSAVQVERVADLFYGGRSDVLLLTIDPDRVTAPLKWEAAAGGTEQFPHIYGELPLDAVLDIIPIPLRPDGRLAVTGLLAP